MRRSNPRKRTNSVNSSGPPANHTFTRACSARARAFFSASARVPQASWSDSTTERRTYAGFPSGPAARMITSPPSGTSTGAIGDLSETMTRVHPADSTSPALRDAVHLCTPVLESRPFQRYTAALARAADHVRVRGADATFYAAVTCGIGITRRNSWQFARRRRKTNRKPRRNRQHLLRRASVGDQSMPRGSVIGNRCLKGRSTNAWANREANRWAKKARRAAGAAGDASTSQRARPVPLLTTPAPRFPSRHQSSQTIFVMQTPSGSV